MSRGRSTPPSPLPTTNAHTRSSYEILEAMDETEKTREQPEVDSVLAAANVLLRVVAQSVLDVDDVVTSPQLRVLVLIANSGPQNLSEVATELNVHPSNATRTTEKLVQAGLIQREEDPADRRFARLTLSPKGRRLVEGVINRRRTAIVHVLMNIPPKHMPQLAQAFDEFAQAAGDVPTRDGRFAIELDQ